MKEKHTKAVDVPRRGSQSTKFGEDFTLFKTFENDCFSSRNQNCIVDLKGENFVSIVIFFTRGIGNWTVLVLM